MNQKDIINALNDIDPALPEEAARKKRKLPKILAAAACLVLILGAAVGILCPWQMQTVNLGGITRIYRDRNVYSQSTALVFPWEYRPIYDQYHGMTFQGAPYRTRANAISESLLTDFLGEGICFGYDIYTDSTREQSFPVYAIEGIDPALLVAVEQGGIYYVFMAEGYDPPATLGQFLDSYALPETLQLDRFSTYDSFTALAHYRLADDSANSTIWELLSACREAPYVEVSFSSPANEGQRVVFTATSEKLGIYKKSFCVSAGGYLDTNIAEYGYVFEIGKEAAQAIIDCVLAHSEEADPEPYNYMLCGTVTEIRDGYFLLDDSLLAAGKGMVFKVPTDDLLIRRWLEFGGVGVGDFICVEYTGGIEDGTVQGAYHISDAYLDSESGHVLIPE